MVLATYLSAPAFVKGKVAIACSEPFTAWLDGEKLTSRATPDSTAGEVSADVKLTQDKHVLVVFAVSDKAAVGVLGATISGVDRAVTADTAPAHPIRIGDYLDTVAISSLKLSAGGDLVALQYRRPEVPSAFSESWVEIRRAADGALLRTIRGDHASSFQWASVGQRFSYVTRQGEKSTLWVDDVAGGPAREVLKDVEHFGSHQLAARRARHRLHAGRRARQGPGGVQADARADRPLGGFPQRRIVVRGRPGQRPDPPPDGRTLVHRGAGRDRRRQPPAVHAHAL